MMGLRPQRMLQMIRCDCSGAFRSRMEVPLAAMEGPSQVTQAEILGARKAQASLSAPTVFIPNCSDAVR